MKAALQGQRCVSNQWLGAHSGVIPLHFAGLYSRRNRFHATNQANLVRVSQLVLDMVACDFCACTPDGPALVGGLFCVFKRSRTS